jgi:catechol 2,3-dioxygenase-like lactoylglutathione lyase family enzyme
MKLESHATVLLVPDVRRAGDYYRGRLGFEVTYY